MKRFATLVALWTIACATALAFGQPDPPHISASTLPHEAIAILHLIDQGGPFRYRHDGIVFQNRERRLPPQPGGYYREYTVATPGARNRGARRIIAGGNPPVAFYYTKDHYRSFSRIQR